MYTTMQKLWDKPPTSTGAGFLNHQQKYHQALTGLFRDLIGALHYNYGWACGEEAEFGDQQLVENGCFADGWKI